MNNLGIHYENGEEKEKNLEKAFHWYQKAAENGNTDAMNNLAILYKNGEGTEKNLEKAFHWYQNAAENGKENAIFNLAVCYENGEGTEKNLEKAFHWYQKVVENGHTGAMFNLANGYYNGEGTEKNLEKAFHWYQKAAENGDSVAMFNLANGYYNGEGTEKNLEKAFQWYQKAAKNDNKDAIINLVICYENGEGTEKNLEKAFYWYQKIAENEVILWTSKNEFVDKFIQEAQLNAKNSYEFLEWIPYNKLSGINYYDKGGFSEIHKAIWLDGPIYSWNFNKQQWNRCNFQTGYEVILKTLNSSSNLDSKFLDEWKYYYNCQKKSFSKFIQFFGFTQDPNNLNYIIIMSYAKKGSLRKCLSDIIKFKWQDKLQLLKKIILGLKVIHESKLTHGDFHDGNILMSDDYNELFIIDLGLCKPISDLQDSVNKVNEIYGVLPYMAPEILRKKPYTPASDIYSFSIIMWEFSSGIPPFNHEPHDLQLSLSICEGKRPEIIKNTPKCYIDLMKKCWDSDPSNRPTIIMLENILSEWNRCISEYYKVNRDGNYKYKVLGINNQLKDDMLEFVKADKALIQEQANTSVIQSHLQAYYTSRKLTEILVQEETQGLDCIIED
ncbi:kinase-like domain-containing protein [Rhizophagus irregularis DAOM 181602=DAOM 197198]|nr:kinase-like domain-containing protein [Rhizophagus irregularis DAOM 181602=DAOM 197198]